MLYARHAQTHCDLHNIRRDAARDNAADNCAVPAATELGSTFTDRVANNVITVYDFATKSPEDGKRSCRRAERQGRQTGGRVYAATTRVPRGVCLTFNLLRQVIAAGDNGASQEIDRRSVVREFPRPGSHRPSGRLKVYNRLGILRCSAMASAVGLAVETFHPGTGR